MADIRQSTVDPDFPDFDPKKSYIIRGGTVNRMKAVMKRNKPTTVVGGGIKIVQITADGTYLAIDAEELTLNVCIGGVSTSKTFYVKRVSSG